MQNEQLGQVVAETMINRLENKTIETRVIDLGYEIIERDTQIGGKLNRLLTRLPGQLSPQFLIDMIHFVADYSC